ncbi:MAG TPA: hypothetical protein VGI69_00820 [Gaiellaceae bacterium]|jgi:hypothetical protein
MTHSRLAPLAFTAAMLIATAPALAGNRGAGQVTPRTLRIEELGPKYLLTKGAHWPPVRDSKRIAAPLTDQTHRFEQLGPKYLLGR